MRKRIPTITRPDTAYAASLVPVNAGANSGKDTLATSPVDQAPSEAASSPNPTPVGPHAPGKPPQREQRATNLLAPMPHTPQQRPERTRKIDIRVNALARQCDRLLACGLNPAHVVRAALRRAVKGWRLEAVYVPPPQVHRAADAVWQARTSIAVDADRLDVILGAEDPLEVLSKWTLIRGQVEPRVWAEIDRLLAELAAGNLHSAVVPVTQTAKPDSGARITEPGPSG